jgi:YHS domain-containing protein
MKLLLSAFVLASLAVAPATQPSSSGSSSSSSSAATTKPTAVNTVCPIGKEPVDPNCKTYEYNGKTIGFCCPGCIADFKKDPEKYMKDLK